MPALGGHRGSRVVSLQALGKAGCCGLRKPPLPLHLGSAPSHPAPRAGGRGSASRFSEALCCPARTAARTPAQVAAPARAASLPSGRRDPAYLSVYTAHLQAVQTTVEVAAGTPSAQAALLSAVPIALTAAVACECALLGSAELLALLHSGYQALMQVGGAAGAATQPASCCHAARRERPCRHPATITTLADARHPAACLRRRQTGAQPGAWFTQPACCARRRARPASRPAWPRQACWKPCCASCLLWWRPTTGQTRRTA